MSGFTIIERVLNMDYTILRARYIMKDETLWKNDYGF